MLDPERSEVLDCIHSVECSRIRGRPGCRGGARRGPGWRTQPPGRLTLAGNNRNKLSLGVDLTKPEGLDLLARLAEQSDVVLTNALPEASELSGRAGFADWTAVRTLAETARSSEDFVQVPQEPWGHLLEPRLLPRYGLADRHEVLLASGAMQAEPGQTTLQASSV